MRSATSAANARRAGDTWTVVLYDMDQAVGEKRGGQVALIFSRLLPKGYERETFAGKTGAHARREADRRAVAIRGERAPDNSACRACRSASIQDGKVVFEGGFGVREIGSAAKPDADTLYIIASNTKALTTLMLAKLARRRQADVGDPGNEPVAVVQARRSPTPRAACSSSI